MDVAASTADVRIMDTISDIDRRTLMSARKFAMTSFFDHGTGETENGHHCPLELPESQNSEASQSLQEVPTEDQMLQNGETENGHHCPIELPESQNSEASESLHKIPMEDQTLQKGDENLKFWEQVSLEDACKHAATILEALLINESQTRIQRTNEDNNSLGSNHWNEVWDYACFLDVVIQALMRLRQFGLELLGLLPKHSHTSESCLVCAWVVAFVSVELASSEGGRDVVVPPCVKTVVNILFPDNNSFQQVSDVSKILDLVFDSLHKALLSEEEDCELEESIGCTARSCAVHCCFGMNIFKKLDCSDCGEEWKHCKNTSFFHSIDKRNLRMTENLFPDCSLDEILRQMEMTCQVSSDAEANGCRKLNHLCRAPKIFTLVINWENACGSEEDISAVLDALTSEIDIAELYHGLNKGNKHSLVSMVCRSGRRYVCLAYHHQCREWVKHDDDKISVIGQWKDVVSTCKRGRLQLQVLFFEALE